MDLVPYIYYEKQEPGSMLCAQHALNNLMQSSVWSPQDLAEIARTLDTLEDSHLQDDPRSTSTQDNRENSRLENNSNCDDSVQVIDDALHRLGLRIISWRSEEMKPMHDYPENQEAFILNHDLHWFTLRRFGQSVDRWYNLNSMADDSPKWIGPTFLSMAIAQAEAEVLPVPPSSDPSAPQPGSLLSCQADDQALLLDTLSYSSGGGGGRGLTLDWPSKPVYLSLPPTNVARPWRNSSSRGIPPDRTRPQTHQDHSPASSETRITSNQATTDPDLLDQLRSIEDEEMAAAISASLATDQSDSDLSTLDPLQSNNPSPPLVSDDHIDEPTPEELRQRRLARFS
ncbi:hypothetical protein PSHT_03310 [Puccinia striiformis]|uniref:Ataxin-3 homolog n=1 Tax=Puccinia striiformis TaxID=27350 RepID=A0A2S4WFR4_9BASI|nr:hypothetical protein PSHT_03310 [Puccinia striiformis]